MQWRSLWYALGGLLWALIPVIAESQGLVPCGTSNGIQTSYAGLNAYQTSSISCNLCDLGELAQRIVNWLVVVSIPVATVLFAYSGWLLFTSGANPTQIDKAKKTGWAVLVGFCIVLGAWLLVQTSLKILLKDNMYRGWNQITCDRQARLAQASRTDLTDFLSKALPNWNAKEVLVTSSNGLTYNADTGCQQGSSWDDKWQGCKNAEGEIVQPVAQRYTGSYSEPVAYKQCYDGDTLDGGLCAGAEGYYSPINVQNTSKGPEGVCPAGYKYAEDKEYAWCQGSGGADDYVDFLEGAKVASNDRTCSTCEEVRGGFQIKNNNQVSGEYNQYLDKFSEQLKKQGVSATNVAITEAWPPTANHSNSCHYTGTCTDIGLRGDLRYDQATVSKIQSAAQEAGGCAVYEVSSQSQCQGISQCKVYPHVTAPHFSLYQNACK
jgi:hypothetical protein